VNSIRILPDRLYGDPVSPLMYGDFVELINDLIPGMWAEKVRDRCFEGPLTPLRVWRPEDPGLPAWQPFACERPEATSWPGRSPEAPPALPQVTFTFDQSEPYVGRQSAFVRVDGASGDKGSEKERFIAGVIQHGIAVRAGQRLRFRMALRAPGKTRVLALIGRDYGAFFKSYAQLIFEATGDGWAVRDGIFVSNVDDGAASLAIGLGAAGSLWLDKVSLMPEDARAGWRADVVDAVRSLKAGIIRFGGSALLFYRWQDGVGPRDRRAPFENRPWGNREENDVGLHEFLEFCGLVGAEPLVCVNARTTNVDDVLEEIEYCNGPATSRWGALRAAMGHPEPFDVHFWQIGNEQAGEAYERTLVEYARAIRGAYPNVVLLASYPSDRIISELSGDVDYICPHLYAPWSPGLEADLRGLVARIRAQTSNPRLRIAITEWNHTGADWGPRRAWLLTLANGLNAARMLNLFQRLGDMIRIANRSNLVNSSCSGSIQTSPDDLFFTPAYLVQRAYANLSGSEALQLQTDPGEPLDLSATRRGPQGEVVLASVNFDIRSHPRRIDLSQLALRKGSCRAWTLTGPALDAVNSFEDKTCVAAREDSLQFRGGTLEYTFLPLSVTILQFG
jgi:alpha-L-arabinofuranosidase